MVSFPRNVVPILAKFVTFMSSLNLVSSRTIQLLGMFSYDGVTAQVGEGCMAGIEMAMRDVRERSELLPGYDLNLTWKDTKCHGGLAVKLMYEMLYDPPPKIMVLGPTCSVEAQATADSSYMWNVTQLSFAAISPALSDRATYPRFFRIPLTETSHNPARVALLKAYNWRRVATIHYANEFFSLVMDNLIQLLRNEGINLVSSEIFNNEPTTQLENLLRKDARIILVGGYDDDARRILCQAYHLGYYGSHMVWIFPGWYAGAWWKANHVGLNCTSDQMDVAATSTIINMGDYAHTPKAGRGINNLTFQEWDRLYSEYTNFTNLNGRFLRATCYDVIWAAAFALDNARLKLLEFGLNKTLDEFTYADSDVGGILFDSMSSVSFDGMYGYIAFSADGQQSGYTKVSQHLGGDLVDLGFYDGKGRDFFWLDGGLVWAGTIYYRTYRNQWNPQLCCSDKYIIWRYK